MTGVGETKSDIKHDTGSHVAPNRIMGSETQTLFLINTEREALRGSERHLAVP